jgi:hypothetical protein
VVVLAGDGSCGLGFVRRYEEDHHVPIVLLLLLAQH